MSAVAHQQVAALAQGGGEIEAVNAPSGAAPFLGIATQNNGRPIKLLQHPRSHDADDADVPEQLTLDNDEIFGGIESGADGCNDLLGDVALDLLTLAIV